jgi:hypothetical protein
VSRERQKAREAREAARRAEVEAAARLRERQARRRSLVPRLSLPRRRQRYGRLPTRDLVRLVAVFLAVQALVWFFFADLRVRLSLAVLSAAVLAVHAATTRSSTTRRSTTR